MRGRTAAVKNSLSPLRALTALGPRSDMLAIYQTPSRLATMEHENTDIDVSEGRARTHWNSAAVVVIVLCVALALAAVITAYRAIDTMAHRDDGDDALILLLHS